jgi:hypothetical protein
LDTEASGESGVSKRGGIEPKDELAELLPPNSRKHLSMPDLIDIRRRERMAKIDAMPVELRTLVHEYGYAIVSTCLDVGVNKPKHIRQVVETILNEFSPTRGSYSIQGIRAKIDG